MMDPPFTADPGLLVEVDRSLSSRISQFGTAKIRLKKRGLESRIAREI
jgi:hypothetical protein